MTQIEGIRIKNYRALKDITLGRLWNTTSNTSGNTPGVAALTPITAVIGKNGVGKSSLFDAFGFLHDCLKLGVEEACDQPGRGGFDRIRSQGINAPIEFELCCQEEPGAQLITYILVIDKDFSGMPHVVSEYLLHQQCEKGERSEKGEKDKKSDGSPHAFLMLINGEGLAWRGESQGQRIVESTSEKGEKIDPRRLLDQFDPREPTFTRSDEIESVRLQDNHRLGIAALGAMKQHPRIAAFREFVEGWHMSCFTSDAVRNLPMAGPQRRLSSDGGNLGNVVQYMQREHSDRFKNIIAKITREIPGIERIDTQQSPDGRLLLRFNDQGFQDPFYAQQMSGGTLKILAYLLMLEDPQPPPFICIEGPENGLYHKLLEVLAGEFRSHATGERNTPQIFVTTHHPHFVDALTPEETWVLEKQEDGFAAVRRASDDPTVTTMVKEGLPLGSLWYSEYLEPKVI